MSFPLKLLNEAVLLVLLQNERKELKTEQMQTEEVARMSPIIFSILKNVNIR